MSSAVDLALVFPLHAEGRERDEPHADASERRTVPGDAVLRRAAWRTLKSECVYLHAWEPRSQARAGVRKWVDFHNRKRPHSTLGGKPPTVVYWQRKEQNQPDQQV
ncbi:integrase core domain-containing protein [Roseibium sp.]|uniref:integrase core domain-containing protein n=1 Tax=Roseibium sp. TaxID=1936156 RepID=UPI003D9C23C9